MRSDRFEKIKKRVSVGEKFLKDLEECLKWDNYRTCCCHNYCSDKIRKDAYKQGLFDGFHLSKDKAKGEKIIRGLEHD